MVGELIPVEVYPGRVEYYRERPMVARVYKCDLCGSPCADDFCAPDDGYDVICPVCFIRWPYDVRLDLVPPGMEMGGTGI